MQTDFKQLLSILASGEFYSLKTLAARLDQAETNLKLQLEELKKLLGSELGYVPNLGYSITGGLCLLDKDKILRYLTPTLQELYADQLHLILETTSTNDYLLNLAKASGANRSICVAEYQTAGKGRHAKTWLSPFGHNIYFSMLWRFNLPPSEVSKLTLAVGVALCELLENFGIDLCQIKWPNDIYIRQKKCAGILCESFQDSAGNTCVITGVGINVKLPDSVYSALKQRGVTDLNRESLPSIDRNLLVAQTITVLDNTMEQIGKQDIHQKWMARDCLLEREVTIKTHDKKIVGIAKGITHTGDLQVLADGQLLAFKAAEVSINRNST